MKRKTLRSMVLAVSLIALLGVNASLQWSLDFVELKPITRPATLVADGPEEIPPSAVLVADGPEEIPPAAVLVADGPEEIPPSAVLVADGPEEIPPAAVLVADGPEEIPPSAVLVADGPEEIPPAAVLVADGPEEIPPSAVLVADGPEEIPPAAVLVADGPEEIPPLPSCCQRSLLVTISGDEVSVRNGTRHRDTGQGSSSFSCPACFRASWSLDFLGEGFEVYTAIPLGRRNPSQTAHDGHSQGWVAAGWLGDTVLSRLVGLSKSEPATQLLLFHLPCSVTCFVTH